MNGQQSGRSEPPQRPAPPIQAAFGQHPRIRQTSYTPFFTPAQAALLDQAGPPVQPLPPRFPPPPPPLPPAQFSVPPSWMGGGPQHSRTHPTAGPIQTRIPPSWTAKDQKNLDRLEGLLRNYVPYHRQTIIYLHQKLRNTFPNKETEEKKYCIVMRLAEATLDERGYKIREYLEQLDQLPSTEEPHEKNVSNTLGCTVAAPTVNPLHYSNNFFAPFNQGKEDGPKPLFQQSTNIATDAIDTLRTKKAPLLGHANVAVRLDDEAAGENNGNVKEPPEQSAEDNVNGSTSPIEALFVIDRRGEEVPSDEVFRGDLDSNMNAVQDAKISALEKAEPESPSRFYADLPLNTKKRKREVICLDEDGHIMQEQNEHGERCGSDSGLSPTESKLSDANPVVSQALVLEGDEDFLDAYRRGTALNSKKREAILQMYQLLKDRSTASDSYRILLKEFPESEWPVDDCCTFSREVYAAAKKAEQGENIHRMWGNIQKAVDSQRDVFGSEILGGRKSAFRCLGSLQWIYSIDGENEKQAISSTHESPNGLIDLVSEEELEWRDELWSLSKILGELSPDDKMEDILRVQEKLAESYPDLSWFPQMMSTYPDEEGWKILRLMYFSVAECTTEPNMPWNFVKALVARRLDRISKLLARSDCWFDLGEYEAIHFSLGPFYPFMSINQKQTYETLNFLLARQPIRVRDQVRKQVLLSAISSDCYPSTEDANQKLRRDLLRRKKELEDQLAASGTSHELSNIPDRDRQDDASRLEFLIASQKDLEREHTEIVSRLRQRLSKCEAKMNGLLATEARSSVLDDLEKETRDKLREKQELLAALKRNYFEPSA